MRKVQPDIQVIKQCTASPPNKRSDKAIGSLMQQVKYLRYFREVGDKAGNKILYDYCNFLQIKSLPSEARLSLNNLFAVVALGRVQVYEEGKVSSNQCVEGSQIKTSANCWAQCQAKGFTILLTLRYHVYQRFIEIQDRTEKIQLKKLKLAQKNEPVFQIFSNLRKSHLLRNLPNFDVRQLSLKSSVISFKKGEKIYSTHFQPKYLYYIMKGQVSIAENEESSTKTPLLTKNLVKNRLSLSIAYANDFFGLEQVFSNELYRTTATSMMETTVICIKIDAVTQIINPVYSIVLFSNIVELVETRSRLLMVRRTRRPIAESQISYRQHNIADKIYDILGDPNRTRVGLRSKFNKLPYRCYLPQKLFHQSKIIRQFLEPPEIKLNDIGVFDKIQNKNKKTQRMTRYHSQFKRQSPRMTSRSKTKAEQFNTPEQTSRKLVFKSQDYFGLQPIQKSIRSTSVSIRQKTKPLRFTDE